MIFISTLNTILKRFRCTICIEKSGDGCDDECDDGCDGGCDERCD